jgi:hypothetical protein
MKLLNTCQSYQKNPIIIIKEEKRMAKLTFLSVLKSNLKCAFCKKENCPVRYMPQRKKTQIYNGTRYVRRCEKDQKAREDAILKKRLP